MNISSKAKLRPLRFSLFAVICLGMTLTALDASARSVIKLPGAHPRYDVELEPHLLVAWDHPGWRNDEGIGPGLRLAIPIVEQGPIQKINNSMAIGFGLDWAYYDDQCGLGDCSVSAFYVPVVLQWNFWLTDVISVFGEPGFGFRYTTWSNDGYYDCPYNPNDARCNYYYRDTNDLDPIFIFQMGGRFMFSDNIGAMVRIGYPYFSAGLTFLF